MYIRQQSGEIIPLVGPPQVQQPIPSTINVENSQPWIELIKAVMSPYIIVLISMYIIYLRFIR